MEIDALEEPLVEVIVEQEVRVASTRRFLGWLKPLHYSLDDQQQVVHSNWAYLIPDDSRSGARVLALPGEGEWTQEAALRALAERTAM